MTELGGSSTIKGVEFEAWFVALKFVDAFFNDDLSIIPQPRIYEDIKTGEIKIASIDDVHIFSENKQEFYNIKSIAPKGRDWTIRSLLNQKVLKQLKDQYQKTPNSILYFVSQSPCTILFDIFQIGASCRSRQELEIRLKSRIKDWDILSRELDFPDTELINFSKQVKFKHIIDIDEMKEIIKSKLIGHITEIPSVPNCLFQLAIECGKNKKTITRNEIINFFKQNNIHIKAHLKIGEITEKLRVASESLSLYSGQLILGQSIERYEVMNIVEWIKAPPESNKEQIVVITGKAGCGKTFVLNNLLKKLQEERIPVLGIKADISQHDSIESLSDELGFSDGIKESLASIVEEYKIGVVLIDQIDALSYSMGKERKYINTYLELILQLSYIKDLRIIISCRSYDLKFDPGLRALESKVKEVKLKELSDTQVEEILQKLAIKRKQLSEALFILLKIPLHLKVFCDIFESGKNISTIITLQDLYNELWEQKISLIPEDSIRKEVYESLDLMVEKMDFDKVITVPISLLDKKIRGRSYLSSESIINIQKQKIQFFHSSFFDYCYSRSFISKYDSLIDLVLSREQGLFVRSQIKQIMTYIRESDTNKYLQELKQFLNNSNIRFHIRLLVINQLAFLDDPLVEEQEIVKKLFDDNNNFSIHFIEGVQSSEWLKFFISSGYLNKYLESKNEKFINLLIWKLTYLINPYSDIILDYLSKFPDIENKEEYISQILLNLDHWENNKSIQLFEKHKTKIKEMRQFGLYFVLVKILLFNPDFVSNLFFNDLKERINLIKSPQDFEVDKLFGFEEIELFEKLMKWNPKRIIPSAMEVVNILIEKTKRKSDEYEYFIDFAFLDYEKFEMIYNHWRFLSIIVREIENVAINDKEQFISLIKNYLETKSFTLIKLIIKGLNSKPESYIQEGFELLSRKGIFEQLRNDTRFIYEIKTLLKNIYPNLSIEQKIKISNIIMKLVPKSEKKKEKGYSSSIGYSKYQLLSTISNDELSKDYQMKKEFLELKRKFGEIDNKYVPIIKSGWVGPPLPTIAYEKMTLAQWLSSFKEYDDSTGWDSPKELGKGGIIQHSRAFTDQVSKRPDDFYDFIFNLGEKKDISVKYLAAGLDGLKKGKYDIEKLINIVRAYWKNEDMQFRKEIIGVIEYIDEQSTLDLELIDILKNYAINDPDPKVENWKMEKGNYYGGDPLTSGINSVRGYAAWALGKHGFRTFYPNKLFDIFEKISEDESVAVKCILIVHLQGMIRWNRKKTYSIFIKLTKDLDKKVIKYSLESILYLITKANFKSFIPHFKKVLDLNEESGFQSVGNKIGQILMFAYVNHFLGSKTLLEEGFEVNDEIKIGAIDFASRHLNSSNIEIKKKSGQIYLKFLNDESDKVNKKYSFCFKYFRIEDFIDIYEYIYQYTKSSAVKNNSKFFFDFLEKCVRSQPEKCIDLMENYTKYETPDSRFYSIQGEPIQIIIEALNRTDNVSYKEKALNIFDSLLQHEAYKSFGLEILKEYDRE